MVDALSGAGLPVHIASPETSPAAGAEVEIDQSADEAGGVFVVWNVSDTLVAGFEAPLLAQDFEHPAVRMHGAITTAMAEALQAILVASGHHVEPSTDEHRPNALRVLPG